MYSCPHGCNRGATFARYVISANKLNAPAAEVIVNGQSAGVLAFALYTLDVTPFLTDGENTVSPVLLSGNRNLLGRTASRMGKATRSGRSHFPIKEAGTIRTIRSHGLIITILFFSELNFNSYTSI